MSDEKYHSNKPLSHLDWQKRQQKKVKDIFFEGTGFQGTVVEVNGVRGFLPLNDCFYSKEDLKKILEVLDDE